MRNPVEALLPALDDLSDWLRLEIGAASRPSQVSLAALTFAGESHLARMLEEAASDPRRPQALVGRDTFSGLANQVVLPQVVTLFRQRRLPVLEAATVHLDTGEDYPLVVSWQTDRIVVIDDDPLAGESGVEVVPSADDLHRLLVIGTVELFEPLVDAVKGRVRVGRNALWGAVADCFAWMGPDVEDPDPSVEDLARFERAATGTPLGMPIPLIEVGVAGGTRLQVGRPTCCFFYMEPADPGEVMPEHLAGPWERYCTTCPLLPAGELNRRLLHRIGPKEEKGIS